jgi:phosphoribosylamine---glycine ligase
MKVLVIGQGGREHALVRALSMSASVSQVHALPGSDGMKAQAICHNLNWKSHEEVINLCLRAEIDFVVIGPEDPLVDGLADSLRERGILVVGPNKDAAHLEGSKVFAKEFMDEAKIPTAKWSLVKSVSDVMSEASLFTAPYVLKADGLAAGKGVFICKTLDELKIAASEIFEKQIFGAAGSSAVLEQFTPGWEMSFLILTNGQNFCVLPVAQDHKRLLDNNEGPNTGGMGTVAPLLVEPELLKRIESEIVLPTLRLIQKRGYVYRGVIFLGLMISEKGPQLLEYNCRFGDPETQVILPLVDGDWGKILKELSIGLLAPFAMRPLHSACVVMASPGYPMQPKSNIDINGDVLAETATSYFIHSGSKLDSDNKWKTNGGRVLGAVGVGASREEALTAAYEQARKVTWAGLQMRQDIGKS